MANPTTEIEYLLTIPIGGLELFQLLYGPYPGAVCVFTQPPTGVDITPFLVRLGVLLATGRLQHHIAAQSAAQYAAQSAAEYLLLCETIVSALEAYHIPNKE